MKEIKREEQKLEDTWDLTKIYKNEEEITNDIKKLENMLNDYKIYKGHLLEKADNLYSVLKLETEVGRLLEKLATYAYRKQDEDLANTKYQELRGTIDNLIQKASSVSAFITPELLKSDFSKIEEFITEKKELEEYQIILTRIFETKDHVLTEEEEKILIELSNILNTPDKVASIIRNSEIKFPKIIDESGKEVELTNENYTVFLKSQNREVRKNAFLALYNTYSSLKDTLTETMYGEVSKNVKLAKIRRFNSAKEASLFASRVTKEVHKNLIETIHDNLDVIYKYFDLKKEVSGLEDYSLYDTYINLVEGDSKKYTYEEAKDIIIDVLKIFGDDYLNIIKQAFNERWIDIYPNKGKRGGAYSAGCYDTVPYILLNYQGTYNDVSTIIHELGHSMHTFYTCKNNLPQYADYKIFVAEVASTVNEMLLNYYMLENSNSKKEKQMILSDMMDNFKATLYRQTMFSEFEDYLHEEVENDQVLTSDKVSEKYYELNKLYFGENVLINDEIRYEWMRIPHFYYNFYVYQYATGLSCACHIVERIKKEGQKAIDDYFKFLSCGNTLDPIESLKLAGVDVTKKEVIESAINIFSDMIENYKKLMIEE